MSKEDRLAFEDAKREAGFAASNSEPRYSWISTVVGVLLGVALLVWLFS
jgi:hypothetical protein